MDIQPRLTEHGTLEPSHMGADFLSAGLLARRAKMFNEARRLRQRLAEIGNDVNAIDRVLSSIGYEGPLDEIMPREKDARMFSNGKLIRTCFDTIRENGSATARDIAVKIIAGLGDDPNDRKQVERLAANVSRCLRKERQRGTLQSEEGDGNGLVWRLVRSAG